MYTPVYQYRCTVLRHLDGDTFEGMIDMGFRLRMDKSVRLKDFDTPEKNSKNIAEREHALAALAFVQARLPVGTDVVLVTAKTAIYDRIEAAVYYIDPATGAQYSLRDVLAANGFAKRTDYPPNP